MNNLSAQLYRWSDRVYQEALSVPSKVAFVCASQPWFEQSLLEPRYQKAMEQHREYLPSLNSAEQAIIDSLDQKGLAMTHLDDWDIPNTSVMWEQAQRLTQILAALSKTPPYKGRHTLTATAQHFVDHPEVFRWAIAACLLRIAENYFRLPVAYDGPSFYYSVADGTERGPRLWHRDKEDWRMLKVAVYFSDVDANSGPFQCMYPQANDYLLQDPSKRYRVLPHSEITPYLPAPFNRNNLDKNSNSNGWYHSCTGRAGTIVFCDTAHYFHRGCPPIDQDRSAVFYSYFSRRPKNPFFCGRSPLSPQQIQQLGEPVSESLQHCLTWPQSLHPLAKLIPKNRVRV